MRFKRMAMPLTEELFVILERFYRGSRRFFTGFPPKACGNDEIFCGCHRVNLLPRG